MVKPGAAAGLQPDLVDRLLAGAAILLLLGVGAAVARGAGHWSATPLLIRGHLLAVSVALALTPVMLLRRRGDRLHRGLGYGWVSAMALTAALSLGVRTIHPGSFSPIHLLSLYVLGSLPLIVRAARRGDLSAHRAMVRGMTLGALLIAGVFTFPFHRLLGLWLFGG